MFRRALIAVVLGALTTACNGGSASPPPFFTGTLVTAEHLYVGNNNTPGTVQQYNIPLTAASTPNFEIASNNAVAISLDASGNMIVGDKAGNLQYFESPLSAASTPAAAFRNGISPSGQVAFMTTGDIWVATFWRNVQRFNRPFSNASRPAAFMEDSVLTSTIGTALDAAQNLYVSNVDFAGGNLHVFPPPPRILVITPIVAGAAYRKIIVSGTQLFVAAAAPGTGRVDVYALPITAASAPAFAITTGTNTPEAVALDAAGRLYVGNLGNSTVTVYTPPFSAASAPSVTLTVGPTPFAIFGIAVGK